MAVTASLYEPGTIVVTRPAHELWAHICNCELPSWQLLARAVSVLFFALVRGHLCDNVLLLRKDGLHHSLHGNKNIMTIKPTGTDFKTRNRCLLVADVFAFKQEHPYLLASALYLRLKEDLVQQEPEPIFKWNTWTTRQNGERVMVFPPEDIFEVTPRTIQELFKDGYGLDFSEQIATLDNLVHSPALEPVSFDTLTSLYGYSGFDI